MTLLSYHPKVDRDRLGIFGVSIGGTLCWLVAATDERVKTSVPIYGCGYNYDRRKTVWGFPDPIATCCSSTACWLPRPTPLRFAGRVLFLGATNDFHGWMDNAYQILSETHVTRRLAFTPRYNHHIDDAQAANLPAWMDWQLRGGPPFPAEPKLELADRGRRRSDGDRLSRRRSACRQGRHLLHAGRKAAAKPVLATCRGNTDGNGMEGPTAPDGAQRQVPGVRQRSLSVGRLPQHEPGAAALRRQSCRVNRARRSSGRRRQMLKETSSGAPFVFAGASTDPIVPPSYFVRSDDRADRDAVCINPALFGGRIRFGIVTHYIGDPGYAGRDGMSLAFDYKGDFIRDKSPHSPRQTGTKTRPTQEASPSK